MNDSLINEIKKFNFVSDEKLEKANFFELVSYLQQLNALEKIYNDLNSIKKVESNNG